MLGRGCREDRGGDEGAVVVEADERLRAGGRASGRSIRRRREWLRAGRPTREGARGSGAARLEHGRVRNVVAEAKEGDEQVLAARVLRSQVHVAIRACRVQWGSLLASQPRNGWREVQGRASAHSAMAVVCLALSFRLGPSALMHARVPISLSGEAVLQMLCAGRFCGDGRSCDGATAPRHRYRSYDLGDHLDQVGALRAEACTRSTKGHSRQPPFGWA